MLAAGAIVPIGLVAAVLVAVLVAVWSLRRRHVARGAAGTRAAAAAGRQDPFDEPVAQRLPPERPGARANGERRGALRTAVVRPVVVRRDGGPPDQERTFALDLGPGGVLLSGPADLALGEVLEVQVDVGERVAGRARVVRETPDGLKGLAFERLHADDRARLERYVGAEEPG